MSHRIDIKVGYRCNNHCQFCVQGDKRSRINDKSSGEIMSVLEKRRRNNDEVVFTGGEATIRGEFFDWVRYARELGYKNIQIQSNGRMFAYNDFCKSAIDAGANQFAFALHGPKERIHDALTEVPGSFEQTVRGIKNLKKLGQRVMLNSVITKINYKALPDIARLLVDLKVDQFQFAFIHINSVIQKDPRLIDRLVARKSEVRDYVKKGLQIGINNRIEVMVEAIPYCFMEGYEDYLSERFIPPTSIEDDGFLADFAKYRKEKSKMKGPRCGECRYNDGCEGPWKEYPEIFGWKEFIPR